MSVPATVTPFVGRSIPAIKFNNVVLPEPMVPSSEKFSFLNIKSYIMKNANFQTVSANMISISFYLNNCTHSIFLFKIISNLPIWVVSSKNNRLDPCEYIQTWREGLCLVVRIFLLLEKQ